MADRVLVAHAIVVHLGLIKGSRVRQVARLREFIEREVPVGEAVNWSAIAAELGYYDQAHLVDEFRELAGVTPAAWRKQ